jgi:hypothetical protein
MEKIDSVIRYAVIATVLFITGVISSLIINLIQNRKWNSFDESEQTMDKVNYKRFLFVQWLWTSVFTLMYALFIALTFGFLKLLYKNDSSKSLKEWYNLWCNPDYTKDESLLVRMFTSYPLLYLSIVLIITSVFSIYPSFNAQIYRGWSYKKNEDDDESDGASIKRYVFMHGYMMLAMFILLSVFVDRMRSGIFITLISVMTGILIYSSFISLVSE